MCRMCGRLFAFYRYFLSREMLRNLTYYTFSALHVVNVANVEGLCICQCGTRVGIFQGESLVQFQYYCYCEPLVTGEHDGLLNEIDVLVQPGDDPDLIWGCVSCFRTIGYGEHFSSRVVSLLDIVNGNFSTQNRRNIVCRCGAYLGYRNFSNNVILGNFISLGDVYREIDE